MLIRITCASAAISTRGVALEFPLAGADRITVLYRQKGSVSGGHIHHGMTQSKSPEVLCFLEGRARVYAQGAQAQSGETHEVARGAIVSIPPGVYHEVWADTDITFLEARAVGESLEQILEDTAYPNVSRDPKP